MNKCMFVGRIATEPELTYTPADVAHCRFRLAVDRRYRSANGERGADFLDVVCWRKAAETMANYGTKGRLISMESQVKVEDWVAKDGTKRRSVVFVIDDFKFLDPAKGSARADMEGTMGDSLNRTVEEAAPLPGDNDAPPAPIQEKVLVGAGVGSGEAFEDPFAD